MTEFSESRKLGDQGIRIRRSGDLEIRNKNSQYPDSPISKPRYPNYLISCLFCSLSSVFLKHGDFDVLFSL